MRGNGSHFQTVSPSPSPGETDTHLSTSENICNTWRHHLPALLPSGRWKPKKNQHLQTPESLLTCFMFLLLHLCAVSFICNTVMCVSLSSMLVYVRIFMHIHIHKCVRVEEVCRNACVIVQCASEVFI